jgi:hypothetical protein
MNRIALAAVLAACSSPEPRAPQPPPAPPTWPLPAGWKHETIPFPLEFAPSLAHRGVEELRFPPGFLDEASPNRWSYAFVWRLDDAAALEAPQVAAELVAYFRGLLVSVDGDKQRIDPSQITATAERKGDGFALTAHIIDTFTSATAVDLVGTARRTSCGTGSLWTFVLAPAASPVRAALDDLAAQAACGQAPVK